MVSEEPESTGRNPRWHWVVPVQELASVSLLSHAPAIELAHRLIAEAARELDG